MVYFQLNYAIFSRGACKRVFLLYLYLIKLDPKKRSSVVELCAHPWILKYVEEDANVTNWLSELFGFIIEEEED